MKKNLITTAWMLLIFALQGIYAQPEAPVKVWEETITLPTYVMKANDPNPSFFQGQSYQGASRVIYPYPAIDMLGPEKKDQDYKALYL